VPENILKKVTLRIDKKEYDINLKDDIADEITKIISGDFERPEDISVKEILAAYIKNSIDKHHLQNELNELYERINRITL